MREIDSLLYLIRAYPSLCPAVPITKDETAEVLLMQHRGHDEVHMCLACGGEAKAAVIAETTGGKRWLDVCWDHYAALAAPDLEGPHERP